MAAADMMIVRCAVMMVRSEIGDGTHGLLADALGGIIGRGSSHLLGGKGLSDLGHFGR